MVTLTIIQILLYLLGIVRWIILIQFVLSILMTFNVINTSNQFVSSVWYALERITEPMYRPIRRFLPNMGGLDLSPVIVLILISIVSLVLNNIAASTIAGGVM